MRVLSIAWGIWFFVRQSKGVHASNECQFYLQPSSVNKGSWGAFAAKEYEKGQVIDMAKEIILAEAAGTSLAWRLWNITLSSGENTFTFLPGLGSVAQHNPSKKNVERLVTKEGVSLIAVRNISPEEELFVDRGTIKFIYDENLPEPDFDNSEEDYRRAYEIATLLSRLVHKYSDFSEIVWADILFRFREEMVKESEQVKRLLPRSLDELERFLDGGPSPTNEKLDNIGICIRKTLSIQNQGFSEGDVVLEMPFHTLSRIEFEQIHSKVHWTCFGHPNSHLLLCPLVDMTSVFFSTENANANIGWLGDKTDFSKSSEALIERATRGKDSMLVLEYTAIKAIQNGEHIVVNVPRLMDIEIDAKTSALWGQPEQKGRNTLQISDELFPVSWLDEYRSAASWKIGEVNLGMNALMPGNEDAGANHEKLLREGSCGLYYAPSLIPGAGFGVFSGVPVDGEGFRIGTPLPTLVLMDDYRYDEEFWVHKNYVWGGRDYGTEYEAYVPSHILNADLGMLANSHPGISNVFPMTKLSPLLDRRIDPGAGASFDYVSVYASGHAYHAGEELFTTYGDAWFASRDDYRDIPLREHYLMADSVAGSLASIVTVHKSKQIHQLADDIITLLKDVTQEHRARIALDALGAAKDLNRILAANGTARAQVGHASLEYLEEHGHCLDNLYIAESNVPQAGRGAFARRAIKRGETIVSSPLLPTFGHQLMEPITQARARNVTVNEKTLLFNYMLGHPQSTILFLPTTPLIGVNHAGQSSIIGMQPNARLEWATWSAKSNYYRRKPLEDLRHEKSSTIIIDLLATKDIEVDEEILMDYGDEWALAWKRHIAEWKSPCDGLSEPCRRSTWYVRNMNQDRWNPVHHEWSEEHFTLCPLNEEAFDRLEIVKRFDNEADAVVVNGKEYGHSSDGFEFITDHLTYRLPCLILGVDRRREQFDVLVFDVEDTGQGFTRILKRQRAFPAESVEFVNKPLRSDMHWEGGFRHNIMIPDEIFPSIWRDKGTG